MENRLELEKTKLEAEKKKTSALTEELNEKVQKHSLVFLVSMSIVFYEFLILSTSPAKYLHT